MKLLGTLLSAVFITLFSAQAAPVFKWTTPDGDIIYASKPPTKDAKPALLPPIVKANIPLTDKSIESCSTHGGIDCEAGADSDGSVICSDSFRDALTRFTAYCKKGKIYVEHVLPVKRLADKNKALLTVSIRNAGKIKAERIAVLFTNKNGVKLPLNGPATIDALSSVDYTFEFEDVRNFTEKELAALTPPKEKIIITP